MSAIKQEPRKFIPLEKKITVETVEGLRAIIAKDQLLETSYRAAYKPGLAKFYHKRIQELTGRLNRLLEEPANV